MICNAKDCKFNNDYYTTHCRVEGEYEGIEIEWNLCTDSAPVCSEYVKEEVE